ncbi:MAG: cytochrome c3 family protein [Rubripirellula sp.]|nr:cytochrome c3 family protein [Rubripirellula sp.]
MARETGKQRSQRIEIDSYRKRTDIHVWRTVCILVGLVTAGLYAAYVIASGGGSQVSTGPVAEAHAAFENDCQQCHQDFTPIGSRGCELNWSLVGLSKAKSVEHTEAACKVCHDVGDHYRGKMSEAWQLQDQNCATCHADHQGRLHDLAAVSQSQCTDCHARLADGCVGTPSVRDSITKFDQASHGEFASLATGDPGSVKFDHQQHMRLGQVDEGNKGAFRLDMMNPANRERYRLDGQADTDAVQLDCSSCHQMAGNPDPSSNLITDGELGRYIEPISFQQHCSACHSMNPGIATADTTPLPHAAAWSQLDLLLNASLVGTRLNEETRVRGDDAQATAVPGEGFGDPANPITLPDPGELQQARQRVEAECQKCHEPEHITDEFIAKAAAGEAAPLIPPRWFQHGLYDHAAHRQVDCAFCHSAAYAANDAVAGPPLDHQKVMIDNIESCTGCHRDAESPTPASLSSQDVVSKLGGMSTWATNNCTLCHRYHTPTKLKEERSK